MNIEESFVSKDCLSGDVAFTLHIPNCWYHLDSFGHIICTKNDGVDEVIVEFTDVYMGAVLFGLQCMRPLNIDNDSDLVI